MPEYVCVCLHSTLQCRWRGKSSAGFTPGIMGEHESVGRLGFSSLGFLCGFASVGQAVQKGMGVVGCHGTIPRNDSGQDLGGSSQHRSSSRGHFCILVTQSFQQKWTQGFLSSPSWAPTAVEYHWQIPSPIQSVVFSFS